MRVWIDHNIVVHETLNVEMHVRSRTARILPVIAPLSLYFLLGHSPIFVANLPIFAFHHLINDGICIKFWKVCMIPCSDGGVLAFHIVCNGILVSLLLKDDELIARMRVVNL